MYYQVTVWKCVHRRRNLFLKFYRASMYLHDVKHFKQEKLQMRVYFYRWIIKKFHNYVTATLRALFVDTAHTINQ